MPPRHSIGRPNVERRLSGAWLEMGDITRFASFVQRSFDDERRCRLLLNRPKDEATATVEINAYANHRERQFRAGGELPPVPSYL
jgi:hypothetical protein